MSERVESRPSIAEEIEALSRLSVDDLIDRYIDVFRREPRVKRHSHLWRKLAWKLQEQRFGGLSGAAKAKLNELISKIELPSAASSRTEVQHVRQPARNDGFTVGTTLEREYRGRRILLQVVDGGFECEGVLYKTLSAAACAISGQHVSGVAWFGIKKRKAAR